jgi:methyl-accepting chemotaxis protein
MTESFEARRRRYISATNILIAVSCVAILIPIVVGMIAKSDYQTLYILPLIFLLIGACLASWFLCRKGKLEWAGWLTFAAVTVVLTTVAIQRVSISLIIAIPFMLLIIMLILNVRVAYLAAGFLAAIIFINLLRTNTIWTSEGKYVSVGVMDFVTWLILLGVPAVIIGNLLSTLYKDLKVINMQASELQGAFNQLQMRQQSSQEVSQSVLSLGNELNSIASQQHSSSQEQAAELTQVAGFVHEIAQTAQNITEQTGKMREDAQNINGIVHSARNASQAISESGAAGKAAVELTIERNRQASQQYTHLKNLLGELQERQNRMQDIVAIIKSVSDETHLLSLNASIEAAGAGIHGERFAVVAGEVKSLAERSRRASQEVNNILAEVETSISAATGAAEQGQQQIETALAEVQQSGNLISGLVEAISQNVAQMEQIERASGQIDTQATEIYYALSQQYTASNQAAENLQNLKIIAGQTASAIGELSRSAGSLEKSSQVLVASFNVDKSLK